MSLGSEWFVVEQRGYDSSGRPLRNTRYMWALWDALKERPRVKPFAWKLVIVQGAFMSWVGGGASASDGFHNLAGCNDIRTWNLTDAEISILIWEARQLALGAWRRDTYWRHGGMAEHCHWGQGGDRPQSYGSAISWSSYVNGGDGLAGSGGDYERRPSPLITTPPAYVFSEGFTVDDAAKNRFDRIDEKITALRTDLNEFRDASWRRDKAAREEAEAAAEKAKLVASRIISKLGNVQDAVGEIDSLLSGGNIEEARTRLQLLAQTAKADL
jgi:hypothetical protein